ncbi:tRNA (guanine-N(7)-)-methyltransferase non-catalytic subunit wdr4 [Triplophysa tibetana]|uniref:tRNA (Guanine-N(7)-)-methyltransferase non-catalytic subunit wdr4 n=1 Tax=Triplophysa tibetana TaxID=1572043 RepID=A0A5A9P1Y0_9TELE|nr:tRNA (guanine-N(7)-)-methyltransferase non-catalytic subunit wdr4 [Triplophysa tibetana]
MAVVSSKGDWFVSSCSSTLLAINLKETRDLFVFDCAKAEKRPKEGDGDEKRWVMRRCTSVIFTQTEDEVYVADKSGDVYSFSVLEPQKPGKLHLGHVSMLLAVALSPDDKYIITADRDEKIRVSFRLQPYNIQAFCLGHREFVSALLVPAGHPDWLLSGSGDGTVKVWHYETGKRLQSIDLNQLVILDNSNVDTEKLFLVDAGTEVCLKPAEKLVLPHAPWDMTFDSQCHLWVLLENEDVNVHQYQYSEEHWELCDTETPELSRVADALKAQWNVFKGSVGLESQYKHLYKVNFDNMASYLQKKQERLEKERKKRAAANGSKPNVTEKRSKTESDTVIQSSITK